MKLKIITFLLFLSASIVSVNAEEIKTIKGIVQNTNGTPISGAVISIKESNRTATTDANGKFEMRINRKNIVTIVCTSSGFRRTEKQLDLNKDNIENLVFIMQENSITLDEVIVTANKRESRLQRTPMAVSAISAKEIEQRKIIDMTDLVMAVPNFMVMSAGGSTLSMMSIRGIVSFSTDPALAVYVDGIPMFDGYATSMQLQDIERVEVLRGPQGTLYGRNALGGVINILTKQPENKLKAFAEAGTGKFNAQEYRAGIASPLIKDKLFASVNGFYTTKKGIYTNKYTGKGFDDTKNYGGNFWLKYLANDRLSFVLNSKLEVNDIIGTAPFVTNTNNAITKKPYYIVDQNRSNLENRKVSTTSFLAKYQFNNWELTSLTSFQYLDDTYKDYDYDFSPYDIVIWNFPVNPKQTWTEELKIVSQNLGKWDITGGLFGFMDNRNSRQDTAYTAAAAGMGSNYAAAPFAQSTVSEQNGKGFAAYAQATYAISNEWKLTGGLRYDYDKQNLTSHNEFEKEPNPVQLYPPVSLSTSNNAISPKINLAYLPTKDITAYANYARGFHSGGVNQYAGANSKDLSYKPEYTDNYEVGIKTEWLEHRLRANFAAFYTYWNDQQQTLTFPEFKTINVGKLYSRGVELEVSAIPVKNLEINLNLGTVDAKYDKLLLANQTGTANIDYKGNRQIFTPDFSSSLSVTYSGKITKDLSFFVVPEWKYLGKQYMTCYNDLVQNPFSLLNTEAGIKYKKAELKFWAKNITDSRYISFVYATYRGNDTRGLLGLPVTWGISAKVSF